MPIDQLATVSVPEARLFNTSMGQDKYRLNWECIQKSELGINPQIDSQIIH